MYKKVEKAKIVWFLIGVVALAACHKEESSNLSDGDLSLQVRLHRGTEIGSDAATMTEEPMQAVWIAVAASGRTDGFGDRSNVILSDGESLSVVLPDGSSQSLEVADGSLSPISGGYVEYFALLPDVPLEGFGLDLVLKRRDGRELPVGLQVPPVPRVVSPALTDVFDPNEPLTIAWESYGTPVTWVRLGSGGDCINFEADIEPTANAYTVPAGVSKTADSCFDPNSTDLMFRQESSAPLSTVYFRAVDVEISQLTSLRVRLAQ